MQIFSVWSTDDSLIHVSISKLKFPSRFWTIYLACLQFPERYLEVSANIKLFFFVLLKSVFSLLCLFSSGWSKNGPMGWYIWMLEWNCLERIRCGLVKGDVSLGVGFGDLKSQAQSHSVSAPTFQIRCVLSATSQFAFLSPSSQLWWSVID